MRIILATLLRYKDHAVALSSGRQFHADRLISYYISRNYTDEELRIYVETGFPPELNVKSRNKWTSTKYLRNRRIALAERMRIYESSSVP